jgi:hypothetical protein
MIPEILTRSPGFTDHLEFIEEHHDTDRSTLALEFAVDCEPGWEEEVTSALDTLTTGREEPVRMVTMVPVDLCKDREVTDLDAREASWTDHPDEITRFH